MAGGSSRVDKYDAVRLVLEEGGEMTNEEVAVALKERFGLDMKAGIVAVIRASFRWQEVVAGKMAESAQLAASNPPPRPKGRKKQAEGAGQQEGSRQPAEREP